jgi:eukaryotic-like serine/threonine-protein kinase
MTPVPGMKLGPYEIVAPLGAGGMGQVYKARDTRLDRIVAVKVLPSTDPELRQRFEREARVIAALTHPHICTLYDVGHARLPFDSPKDTARSGHHERGREHSSRMVRPARGSEPPSSEEEEVDYLVMELLDGETLAQRLSRGALPLDEALRYAITIADALDTAHRAGIIHRDLKPANIMLSKSGPKLLDFGIAKLLQPAGRGVLQGVNVVATKTTPLTQQGTIVGTPQYMAPEVMEGAEADARSDVWAFGTVLHEMLSGRRAFEGKSTAALMAAILEHDPAPLDPPPPSQVAHVLSRCLAKDPDDRWQTARDLLHELKWIAQSGTSAATSTPTAPGPARRSRILTWSVAAGLGGLVLGGLIVQWGTGRPQWFGSSGPATVTRSFIGVAPADQLQSNALDQTSGGGRPSRVAMALSPDGRSVLFSAIRQGRQQLFLRAMDQLEAAPLDDTVDGSNPFFSPDGKWIGFWAGGALKKVAVGGGPATKICDTLPIFGASWGSNDTIVFANAVLKGLLQVPASGGTPQAVTTLDTAAGELGHRLPQLLPGNQSVLFTVVRHFLPDWNDSDIVVQSLATGQRKTLVKGADARYLPTGHLIFVRSGSVLAAPFDVQRLEISGGAVTILADVMQAANSTTSSIDTGAGQFSVSSEGSLLYLPGGIHPDPVRTLAWVDRSGAVQPLPLPPRAYLGPRLSPDGRQILVWTQGTERIVWLYDIPRGTLRRVTTEGRSSRGIWMPDGRRVTFTASTAGPDNLFSKAADGSGSAERLTTSGSVHMPSSWSPDGQTLLFVETQPGSGGAFNGKLYVRHGSEAPQLLRNTRAAESEPEFSPDGHWIAYVSNESGSDEVYVQAFPGPGPRHAVSNGGGRSPGWSRDGREFFYVTTQDFSPGASTLTRMMSVPVTTGQTFTAGVPRVLFEGRFTMQTILRGWDITADGKRFLMVVGKDRVPVRATQMIYVQNWFEELNRRVPPK